MKGRIENEVVKADELERNVKLGRGGIREIEFVVQALQLLHAGRQPFLQGAQTLPCLAKLVQYELLSAEEAQNARPRRMAFSATWSTGCRWRTTSRRTPFRRTGRPRNAWHA